MFSIRLIERIPSTWRLAILQAITVTTGIAICLTLLVAGLRRNLETTARQQLINDLGKYAAFYELHGPNGLHHIFDSGGHELDQAIRITSQTDQELLNYDGQQVKKPEWPSEKQLRRMPDVDGLITVEHPNSDSHLLVGRRVLPDGFVLWLRRSDADNHAQLQSIFNYLLLAAVAATLIALVPVFWYAGQVMRPVRSMIKSAQALSRGLGEERLIAASAVPELKDFASAFNHALDRNSALTNELQSANDHLAHELRTPLARIRGNFEVFHEAVTDPAALEAAARAMDEIDRATSLVQTILTVRAGEHNALKLHKEPTTLLSLVAQLADLYVVSAEDKNISLSVEGDADTNLFIDQQRITQAIANLLDNALAYTPEGGAIDLRVESTPTNCKVHVMDTGPGIRADEVDTIWQRFRRGAAANAKTPGMGLGLSLVRAVALAHGGNAGVTNREKGGSDFWIELPR